MRGHFWPQGHNLNTLRKSLLGDTTYQIIKAQGLVVSKKKYVLPLYANVKHVTPGRDQFWPQGKVGRSKPPPVLTSGFNQLKPLRSISQKVVNTGQYESEWSIEIFKWPFWWWIEILGQVLCSIY